jgi:hypothetical protein
MRRLKTGETGQVTPNEFKVTLVKLGIIIPENYLYQLFSLFDADNSGKTKQQNFYYPFRQFCNMYNLICKLY